MSLKIFDDTFNRIEKGVERANKIQATIAQNIANANNPEFEALEFDTVLNKAVKRMDQPRVVLEDEMAELSKNSMNHSAYIKLLTTKLSVMRIVATMGRK